MAVITINSDAEWKAFWEAQEAYKQQHPDTNVKWPEWEGGAVISFAQTYQVEALEARIIELENKIKQLQELLKLNTPLA